MAIYKQNIVKIDLNAGNIHRSFLNHSIGKNDSGADHFGISVFRGKDAVDLTGVTVQGYFRDPQGNNIAITSGNTVSGNTAEVVLPQACYNYEGQFCLAIKLIGGGITGTVRIVDGMVDNTNTGGAVAPTGTVPTYQEILAVYEDMQEAVADYEEVVATQNGKILELKGDIDEDYKKIINIGGEVGLEYIPQISFTDGKGIKYADGSLQNSSIRSYSDFFKVEGFDKIVLTMMDYTAGTNFGIAFYANNDASTFISGSREKYNATVVGHSERTFNIPATAKYCRTTWCSSSVDDYSAFSCKLIKDGTEINSIKQNIIDIQKERFLSIGKNLIDSTVKQLYPVYLPAGSTITISTADGTNMDADGQRIYYYNASGELINYNSVSTGVSQQTIQINASYGDIYYISLLYATAVPLQIEIGENKTAYEEYFPPARLISAEQHEQNVLIGALDTIINDSHEYINYGYDQIYEHEKGTGSQPSSMGIKRYLAKIVLDNTNGTYSSAIRVKINGQIEVANSDTVVKTWNTTPVNPKNGHKYEVSVELLSGTLVDQTQIPAVSIYKVGQATSQGTAERTATTYRRVFTADGSTYNIVLYIYAGSVFTNAEFLVLMRDITNEDEEHNKIEPYYLSEAEDTIAKVRKETDSPALVFPVVTDIHRYSTNAAGVQTFDKMIANMRYVTSRIKCDFLLNLGDMTDGHANKETTQGYANDCLEKFLGLGVPYVWSHGNHDNNYELNYAYVYSLNECYAIYFSGSRATRYNFAENGTDYYIDFDAINVRLIIINSNNSTEEVRYAYGLGTAGWLETALNTDYTVIIGTHLSPISTQVYDTRQTVNAAGINDALNDFVENGGNLIMLSGHSHHDVAYITPWLSVMQDCQRFSDISETITDETHGMSGFIDNVRKNARIAETESEDCWSVCIYKPIENELDMIRFGAGPDRYFHATPVGASTVTTKLSGTVAWSTSDATVATVNGGVITSVGSGRCAVIAKDENANYECWIVEIS